MQDKALTKTQRSISSFPPADMNDYLWEATCGCFNLLPHSTAWVRLSLVLYLSNETPLKLSSFSCNLKWTTYSTQEQRNLDLEHSKGWWWDGKYPWNWGNLLAPHSVSIKFLSLWNRRVHKNDKYRICYFGWRTLFSNNWFEWVCAYLQFWWYQAIYTEWKKHYI